MHSALTTNGSEMPMEVAYSQGSGFVPATTIPVYGPTTAPYVPPYISVNMRATVSTRWWSTGLCHCLDDPANYKKSEIIVIHNMFFF